MFEEEIFETADFKKLDLLLKMDNINNNSKFKSVDVIFIKISIETVCCLYHQKKDFISVPYEPQNTDYLQQLK